MVSSLRMLMVFRPGSSACYDVPLMGISQKKFEDYYLSVGMPSQQPLFFKSGDRLTLRELPAGDTTVDLKIDLDLLLEVFPYELME